MTEPLLRIGILTRKEVTFTLNGKYLITGDVSRFYGPQKAVCRDNEIWLNDSPTGKQIIIFNPDNYENGSFELDEVVIGIQFHWERTENQRFKGSLQLKVEGDKLVVINILNIEDYLVSVISSEMSATSNLELLKAHAIISRSWLLAQIAKSKSLKQSGKTYKSVSETDDEYIRWYDREDHVGFDVCADDHCQRYQGIARQSTPLVEEAVYQTRGLMLMYNGSICDARFSKSCGGISEAFENVWEPEPHAYLQAVVDNSESTSMKMPCLTDEDTAQKWIRSNPDAFCNTHDKTILSQVLNDYDQETTDFYRWKVCYQQAELAELIARKSGRDFGAIIDLVPVERGTSGRLKKLKIVGEKLSLIIGKELEIRKTLSESHLYSSAFVIDKHDIVNGLPGRFEFTGAGWGHGVGLCQIGAAVMGARGYAFDKILLHYFKGAILEKVY